MMMMMMTAVETWQKSTDSSLHGRYRCRPRQNLTRYHPLRPEAKLLPSMAVVAAYVCCEDQKQFPNLPMKSPSHLTRIQQGRPWLQHNGVDEL